MDYNYVRMRNALKSGDIEAAERYKILYETGKENKHTIAFIDYVIVILFIISLLLSVYILYSEQKLTQTNNAGIATGVPTNINTTEVK